MGLRCGAPVSDGPESSGEITSSTYHLDYPTREERDLVVVQVQCPQALEHAHRIWDCRQPVITQVEHRELAEVSDTLRQLSDLISSKIEQLQSQNYVSAMLNDSGKQ